MQNRELTRQMQALRTLFGKVQLASGGDIEIQAHWARYLCVLVAGFLENALVEVYSDFCRRTANPKVANYSAAALKQVRNPKTQRFVEVTSSFDKAWAAKLQAFAESNGGGEAINSIMANRHLIAHGRSSGVTIDRLRDYFEKSVKVVEFLEVQCE